MTLADLEHFKNLLIERKENVSEWLESGAEVRNDDVRKARELLNQIQEGLKRVEDHSYGTCIKCQGEIPLYRLEVQPVEQICIECYSKEQQAQLEEELYLASKIHRALLPQTIAKIDGFEIAVKSLAARHVGGDYFDFLRADGGSRTRVIIADIMGKGLPAGLLMSNVQGALRILAVEIESPSALMTRLNQWVCRNVPVTKFISLACLALDTGADSGGRVTYANAGHCPPLIFRKSGDVQQLDPTGGVLGVHEAFTYEEIRHELLPGDMILLYTDGVTEAENLHGDMFGESRLIEFVKCKMDSPLEIVLDNLHDEVIAFTERPELADDFTLLALRKT